MFGNIKRHFYELYIRLIANGQRNQGRHVAVTRMSLADLNLCDYKLELKSECRSVTVLFSGLGKNSDPISTVTTHTKHNVEVFNTYSQVIGGISVSSTQPFSSIIVHTNALSCAGMTTEQENTNVF